MDPGPRGCIWGSPGAGRGKPSPTPSLPCTSPLARGEAWGGTRGRSMGGSATPPQAGRLDGLGQLSPGPRSRRHPPPPPGPLLAAGCPIVAGARAGASQWERGPRDKAAWRGAAPGHLRRAREESAPSRPSRPRCGGEFGARAGAQGLGARCWGRSCGAGAGLGAGYRCRAWGRGGPGRTVGTDLRA